MRSSRSTNKSQTVLGAVNFHTDLVLWLSSLDKKRYCCNCIKVDRYCILINFFDTMQHGPGHPDAEGPMYVSVLEADNSATAYIQI